MEARTDPDGALVLTYDSTTISRVLFALAVLAVGTACYDFFIGARGTDRLIGLIGATVTLGGAGLATFERARVRIDAWNRSVEWRRQWAWSRHSGRLAFADVAAIRAERAIGDDPVPSRRIVLVTRDGVTIPFTKGFGADGTGALVQLADRVREIVQPPERTTADTVQALVREGRVLDAIKLLREHGLSLEDAHARVKDLRAATSPGR